MKSHMTRRPVIKPGLDEEPRRVKAEVVESRALAVRTFFSGPEQPFVLPTNLTFEQYLQIAHDFTRAQRYMMWRVGDFLNYGAQNFDEEHMERVLDALSVVYTRGTLDSARRIAEAFPAKERNLNLSWNHHQAVKTLPKLERRHWLKRAEEDKLSYRAMITEIQQDRRKSRARTAHGPVVQFHRISDERLITNVTSASNAFHEAWTTAQFQWQDRHMFDHATLKPPTETLRDWLNQLLAALVGSQKKGPAKGRRRTDEDVAMAV